MLPIIGFPGVVEEFAEWFSRNLSFHQLRRFKQYLSGLITGVKPTIRRMASRLRKLRKHHQLKRKELG